MADIWQTTFEYICEMKILIKISLNNLLSIG